MKPKREEEIDRPGENERIKELEVSICSKSIYNKNVVRKLKEL